MLFAGMLPASEGVQPTRVIVQAAQPDLPELAQGLPLGGQLSVQGIAIEGQTADTLELSRFQVFTPDAKIVVDNDYLLSPPDQAYYRGRVQGDPDALAVLIIPASGEPEGLILGPRGVWQIEKRKALSDEGLHARKLKSQELAPLKQFRCGTDSLGLDFSNLDLDGAGGNPGEALGGEVQSTVASVLNFTARVAVETDYEFYDLFDDVGNATNYVGSLFAYISGIYVAETATSLQVSYLRLWTSGASGDPWTITSDTSNALYQFRDYWNANMGQVDRTIAHMLSGKALGGGIAYLGVLCDSSYGYGLSASLSSTTLDTTKTLWDTLVVAHEIGHNFNSPHTHDYCNLGGSPQPVDACVPSAYGGACNGSSGQLPSSCPGSGQGCGTIMSYCHLISGGYDNIAMTFGLGHPYGVFPDRVPQQMVAHVQSRAQSYPVCLTSISANDPDFVVTGITLNPAAPTANGTFSATVTVKNQGTVSGSGGLLDVWTDQASSQGCGATGTQRTTVGTLAAGASASYTFTGLSAGTAATKTFRAFIDSGCTTAESSDANNQTAQSYTVGGAGQPDFVVTGITLSPAAPTANGTFSATVTVKNQGTVSGSGGWLDVWANQSAATSCRVAGNKYVSVGTLAAGASANYTLTGLSAGTAGTKTFRAFVDSYCQSSESNESNNQTTQGYTVN